MTCTEAITLWLLFVMLRGYKCIVRGCSWGLRKILNVPSTAKQYIRYLEGQNSDFLIWHDPWVSDVPFLHQYSPDIITIAGSMFDKVKSFIREGRWTLPSSNHVDMIALRNQIASIQIQSNDEVVWDGKTQCILL